ncbi:MAG TPA: carbamoyltransferase C-terminal domain-containing protein [Gemmatimonadaceae bacterium]|nr:carbamoyltransferase C-terminal domain-containing protein [Gemmatimonadaceae bacterium]
MYILGINAYHGDASAVLIRDGVLIGAVEEERFRRIKHWAGFPSLSIRELLRREGIGGKDVAHFAIGRAPTANLMRRGTFALRHASARQVAGRLKNLSSLRNIKSQLGEALDLAPEFLPQTHFVEHHPAHIASSFFVSPFDDAACCAIDGFGDFVSTSTGLGSGNQLEMLSRVYFPHSLGLLYTAVTQYLGFMGYGDEFKVMGLAPYGRPRFVNEIRQLLRLKSDGAFELDLKYFRHWSAGVKMEWEDGYPTLAEVFSDEMIGLLGPQRDPKAALTEREEDLAHSLQVVYEQALIHVLTDLWERTHNERLCLSGGCAMNSVANGKIRALTPFKELYIQPASSDNGTALGAAYYVWNQILRQPRGFVMDNAYWGPEHDEDGIAAKVTGRPDAKSFSVERFDSLDDVATATARLIADGKVVGWYQGRMEWGARALGNRSIVADPRRADMRELINTKIKFREKFRPFAPSIAEESLDEYFVGAVRDPFMLQVYPIRDEKKSVIPAVTHVDGSGRLQTVSNDTNPLYYRLIKEFEKLTGVPIVLNTSFNENEPIVDTPEQALDCFLRTKMDAIALNRTVITRV